MSLTRNIDGYGVCGVLALTMGDLRYGSSHERARQRPSRHSVISDAEFVPSPPELLIRHSSAAGVQPT